MTTDEDRRTPRTLAGQVAIVTGGARGIGWGIVEALLEAGTRVVVWDVDFSTFPVETRGKVAGTVTVDVGDYASVEAGFQQTLKVAGPVDILVNNAGINGQVVPAWDCPLEDWHRVLRVDLTGVFHCCRVAVPGMRERGYGRIVNIASIAGKEGNPGIAAYSAAKAGVIGFTKALAKDLVGSGVLANSITPVIVETDIFAQMTPEHIAAMKAKIPMGRFLEVAEVAAMTRWVASPECSFSTGAVFDISGGRATY